MKSSQIKAILQPTNPTAQTTLLVFRPALGCELLAELHSQLQSLNVFQKYTTYSKVRPDCVVCPVSGPVSSSMQLVAKRGQV